MREHTHEKHAAALQTSWQLFENAIKGGCAFSRRARRKIALGGGNGEAGLTANPKRGFGLTANCQLPSPQAPPSHPPQPSSGSCQQAKFSCWWVHARMPGRAGKGWKGSERVGEGSEKGKGKGRENQGGKGASYGPGGYCQRAIGGRGSGTRPGGAGVTHSNRSNRFCRCVITPAVYQHKRVVLSGAAPRWPT